MVWPISIGFSTGPVACSSSVFARPSQNCDVAYAALITVGALRPLSGRESPRSSGCAPPRPSSDRGNSRTTRSRLCSPACRSTASCPIRPSPATSGYRPEPPTAASPAARLGGCPAPCAAAHLAVEEHYDAEDHHAHQNCRQGRTGLPEHGPNLLSPKSGSLPETPGTHNARGQQRLAGINTSIPRFSTPSITAGKWGRLARFFGRPPACSKPESGNF